MKLLMYAVCASLLSLSGCGTDEPTPTPDAPTVAQDWALVSKTTTVARPTATAVASTAQYASGCRVVYRPDGSWQSSGPGIPTQKGAYTVAGNTLTIMLGGRPHALTVAQLTATRMQTREVVEEPGCRAEILIYYAK